MDWLIAYDIVANRRRARIARCLERAGLRLQKSVFLVRATAGEIRKLAARLQHHIDPGTDRLSCWPLREKWPDETIEIGLASGPVDRQSLIW